MPVPFISPIGKRISLYSDFHKDLTSNPISGDLAIKRDEEAVKESIKNLLLTDRGERLFQPNLGGDIRAMLFENNTPATIKIMQEQVKATIQSYEPRVELINVEVTSSLDTNTVRINVLFYIKNNENPINVSVFLERIR
jgi:phage baseplate assembly protein W